MKQSFAKRIVMAALALCMVPAALMAQEDKVKDKEKDKTAKKQIITITRSGDDDKKTVIEIDGDKVRINGKDAADLKDVHVNVHNLNLKGSGTIGFGRMGTNDMNFGFDLQPSIFKVDSNRAMLGVTTDTDDKGAKIQSITKESAAEKLGLKQGDVITKIDNRRIEDADDVSDAVRSHKPGDKVAITYLRDGKEQKGTAELGRWKGVNITSMTTPKVLTDQAWREKMDDKVFERTIPGGQGNSFYINTNRPKLGMSVQDTDDGKGVKVLDIDDEGTAFKAGIKEGDLITKIDGKDVNSADEVAKLVKEKKDQPMLLFQLNRAGKTQTVEVKFPKKIKTVDL